ncbi:hypothetical protein N7471_005590, partial [Penicillium samsonianum]|uniref:uncharacterized protein n=1 Tax=Penicillium samsonianum TaxID=1882272 RepID=UPI002546AA10
NPSGLTPDDSAPVPNTWRYTGDSKNSAGTRYPPDDGRVAPSAGWGYFFFFPSSPSSSSFLL